MIALPRQPVSMPVWFALSTAVALVLACWAALFGIIPAFAIPWLVTAGMVTMMITAATTPREHRQWLTWMVGLAFAVHASIAVVIYAWVVHHVGEPVLFPDERNYDLYSSVFADSIRNLQLPDFRAGNPGYFAVITATYLAWGHDPFYPRIINLAVSGLLMVPVFGLANSLFGESVARGSALLVGFAPAFLLLPAFLIKDLYIALLIAFILWQWLELPVANPLGRRLALIIGASIVLFTFRPQAAAVVLIAPAVWYLLGGRERIRNVRPVVAMIGLGVLGLAAAEAMGLIHLADYLAQFAAQGRQAILERSGEGSFIATFVLTNSPVEKVLLLPAFLLQPLIQPIPIFNDDLATILAPASIFLYGAYLFVILGVVLCLRQRMRDTFLVWGTIALLLLASYVALYVSFRYRFQYEPLLMILAAFGYTQRQHMARWAVPAYVALLGVLVVGYAALKITGVASGG